MFRKAIINLILGVVGSLFSASLCASEVRLKQFFKEVHSFQADFEQRVVDEAGQVLEFKTGVFSFLRPGKFRWNYASIDEQEALGQQIISDGEVITFYEPDLETANQRSMRDAVSQVPTLLLVQSGASIDAHFTVEDYGKTDGLTWIGLSPKNPDSGYQSLMIGFDEARLSAFIMTDALGNETRLQLSNVVTNLTFKKDLFKFKPSGSTDVVRR